MKAQYELHTGKFGQYFYNTRTGQDVPLQTALAALNAGVLVSEENENLIKQLKALRLQNKELREAAKEFIEIATDLSHPNYKQFLTLKMDAEITAFLNKHALLIQKLTAAKEGGE